MTYMSCNQEEPLILLSIDRALFKPNLGTVEGVLGSGERGKCAHTKHLDSFGRHCMGFYIMVLHGISTGKHDQENVVARSPTWTPTSLEAFLAMLLCEFRGTLIHGMNSNGHPKVGRPEILSSRKTVAPKKPFSSDVAGSIPTHVRGD